MVFTQVVLLAFIAFRALSDLADAAACFLLDAIYFVLYETYCFFDVLIFLNAAPFLALNAFLLAEYAAACFLYLRTLV